MADVFTKKKRSFVMSRIGAKDTKPEMLVRKFLFANGFRYRSNVKTLPGSPDVVLKKLKIVIFVHGCFWHGHLDCKFSHLPKTRKSWWKAKIDRNRERDAEKRKELKKAGWKVIEIYECNLKPKKIKRTLPGLLRKLARS